MPELSPTVERLAIHVFEVPTDAPESDATLTWEATTVVVVEVHSDGRCGLGYTYGPRAVASVIDHELRDTVCGSDPLNPRETWEAMHASLRNAGQSGVGAMAIAALDIALHDLRARLLGVSFAVALGAVRDAVAIYGSGGFTSYPLERIAQQAANWAARGIPRVKIKVGRDPEQDPRRLAVARRAVGPAVELMVDANGAFSVHSAICWAERYAQHDVRWFEEPVSQDDPAGLRRVRDRSPAGIAIASGEYCWSRYDAARLLTEDAVDVVQADVTRCCGPTELSRIDALCAAANRPLSLHCAPAISAHVGCALPQLLHLEYFHDHVRIEGMLFDGVPEPSDGVLRPDAGVAGHGLTLRRPDSDAYAVS